MTVIDTEQITCPSCGSSAQVQLAKYLSPLRHAMDLDPRVRLYHCLRCSDYYTEDGGDDE